MLVPLRLPGCPAAGLIPIQFETMGSFRAGTPGAGTAMGRSSLRGCLGTPRLRETGSVVASGAGEDPRLNASSMSGFGAGEVLRLNDTTASGFGKHGFGETLRSFKAPSSSATTAPTVLRMQIDEERQRRLQAEAKILRLQQKIVQQKEALRE